MFALDFDDIMRMAKDVLTPRQLQIYGLYYYGKWSGDADVKPFTQYAIGKRLSVSQRTVERDLERARVIMNPVIAQRRAQSEVRDSVPPKEGGTRFIVVCELGGDVIDKTDTTALQAHRGWERKKHAGSF